MGESDREKEWVKRIGGKEKGDERIEKEGKVSVYDKEGKGVGVSVYEGVNMTGFRAMGEPGSKH
ncbi:hypothetical protein, partial [Bacillus subtilis]|uniref:hypothetical protein n=1 Tax=Bacillus subtilis TaxID=1423 RepID=UPI001BDBB17E